MPFRRKSDRKTNIKKMVKNMINSSQETKTAIYNFGTVNVSQTGVNYAIADLDQGIDQNDRIGNAYRMSSFRLKGAFFHGDLASDLCRVIVYIPKDPTHLISTSHTCTDPVDQDFYTVLSDKMIPLSKDGQGCKLYNTVKLFNKGKRNGLHVGFSGPAANTCTKNRLMVYIVSMSSAAPHPTFRGYWRTYFKDA